MSGGTLAILGVTIAVVGVVAVVAATAAATVRRAVAALQRDWRRYQFFRSGGSSSRLVNNARMT